jgi:competence protein ComEC
MDSTGVYPPKITPEILIITGSPKINFDRVLSTLRPKRVVADATNYKTFVTRWSKLPNKKSLSCHSRKGKFCIGLVDLFIWKAKLPNKSTN